MLTIKNLYASRQKSPILKGLNLSIETGQVHVIMGPNGAGKSSLSKVIAGHPDYQVDSGDIDFEINFQLKSILHMTPDERAKEGIFLAFQYPMEIPGVNNKEFLRAALNSILTHQGAQILDPLDFDDLIRSKLALLSMNEKFLDRDVNVDFSGGEKKRNEMLQISVLSPKLSILDEIDSGLDVDSLKQVSQAVNDLKTKENSWLIITHYERLLKQIKPDVVHVLYDGKIIKTGDESLAKFIEKNGYEDIIHG